MKAFLICCFFVLYAYSSYGVQGCGATYKNWDTNFGIRFKMECNSGESMYNIQSAHVNKKEDRVWGYHCRENQYITTSCRWHKYVNDYDRNVENFICPGEGYMVGMSADSQHSVYKDRRFHFKCCDAKPNQGQSSCYWTYYVNDWDKIMRYTSPSGYYIAGAHSTHHNVYEDRRWKFYICR